MDATTVTGVIVPEPGATSFTVGERTYRKAASLSARRYGIMELLQQEMLYGRDPVSVFKANKDAFELLNKQKFAEAAVIIHGNMTGAARIADRDPHPAIKMFCLFWNYEGEDSAGMTDEQMALKVEDMMSVDVGFVFQQAASSAPGFLAAYRLAIAASSNEGPGESGSGTTS